MYRMVQVSALVWLTLALPDVLRGDESATSVPATPGQQQETDKRPHAPSKAEETKELEKLLQENPGWFAAQILEKKRMAATDIETSAKKEPVGTARKYVLLKEGCRLFAETGRANKVREIIDEIASHYRIDEQTKLKSLLIPHLNTVATVADGKQLPSLIEEASLVADGAIAKRLNLEARKLAEIARAAALRLPNTSASKKPHLEKSRLQLEYLDALITLNTNPSDQDACLAVGRRLCFVLGNWDEGLPKLANASETSLRDLAKDDLKFVHDGTSDSDAQLRLGDGWWNIADTHTGLDGTEQHNLRVRAAKWYEKARANRKGYTKIRLDDRIQKYPPAPANGR